MQIIIYDNTNDYKVDVINLDNYDLESDDQQDIIDIIVETVTDYKDSMDEDSD
tara:strand:- start:802 stop:960 length:159 start_codon:yes stop_codon:yes gene_type:complete